MATCIMYLELLCLCKLYIIYYINFNNIALFKVSQSGSAYFAMDIIP